MHLRNSPIARTPPKNMSSFPDILLKSHEYSDAKENGKVVRSPTKKGNILLYNYRLI